MAENESKSERRKQHDPIRVTQRNYAKLPDGTYKIDKGVYLRRRDGRGSYFLRVLCDGKRKDVALGSASDLTPDLAKAKAARIKGEIDGGSWDWDSRKKKSYLLRDFWEDAIETCARVRQWKDAKRRIQSIRFRMENYVLPVIGDIDVRDIKREDILRLVEVEWQERSVLWDRIRIYLSMILGVAVTRGLRSDNPAVFKGGLEYFLPTRYKVHKIKHYPAPTLDQARYIASVCGNSPHILKRLIFFVALTVLRSSEATSVKWSDVDLEKGIVIVRDDAMKISRGYDRRIPLSRQLVERMRTWERMGDLVFTSDGIHETSACSSTTALKMIQPGVTIHGFRTTFCVWCAENGVDSEVAERCLDHTVGSKVRQAYQRSDLLELRREALQRYADVLMG